MEEWKPDRILDCKGLICPEPILHTKKALNKLTVGQILQMQATDPGSKPDIESFTKRTGHELLQIKEEGGVFIFYIRKAE